MLSFPHYSLATVVVVVVIVFLSTRSHWPNDCRGAELTRKRGKREQSLYKSLGKIDGPWRLGGSSRDYPKSQTILIICFLVSVLTSVSYLSLSQ